MINLLAGDGMHKNPRVTSALKIRQIREKKKYYKRKVKMKEKKKYDLIPFEDRLENQVVWNEIINRFRSAIGVYYTRALIFKKIASGPIFDIKTPWNIVAKFLELYNMKLPRRIDPGMILTYGYGSKMSTYINNWIYECCINIHQKIPEIDYYSYNVYYNNHRLELMDNLKKEMIFYIDDNNPAFVCTCNKYSHLSVPDIEKKRRCLFKYLNRSCLYLYTDSKLRMIYKNKICIGLGRSLYPVLIGIIYEYLRL
jgi:hypothetical protein